MTGRLVERAAAPLVAAFAAVAPLLWWRSWPLTAFY